jgi:hypothetical protein
MYWRITLLTDKQMKNLRYYSNLNAEKAEEQRSLARDKAASKFQELRTNHLFLAGVMLYWSEGTTARKDRVDFTNADPLMIKIIMKFFREICLVPEEKFRLTIYLYQDLDEGSLRKFWTDVTGINFYDKSQVLKGSDNTKRKSTHGTLKITIYNSHLQEQLLTWIKMTANNLA